MDSVDSITAASIEPPEPPGKGQRSVGRLLAPVIATCAFFFFVLADIVGVSFPNLLISFAFSLVIFVMFGGKNRTIERMLAFPLDRARAFEVRNSAFTLNLGVGGPGDKAGKHRGIFSDLDDKPELSNLLSVLERKRGRAVDLLEESSRRAGMYLIVGTLISLSGICFFLVVSWDYISSIGVGIPTSLALASNAAERFWSDARTYYAILVPMVVAFLPKITVLIVVQVIANFFLRQYKSYVEQSRYFDRIARRCEAEIVSFLVRFYYKDRKEMLEYAALQDIDKQIDIVRGAERSVLAARLDQIEQNDLPLVTDVYERTARNVFGRWLNSKPTSNQPQAGSSPAPER